MTIDHPYALENFNFDLIDTIEGDTNATNTGIVHGFVYCLYIL
jgi:hypothetical protein